MGLDMTNPQRRTHRTVPIPDTITSIGRGYPDKLVIFKIPASKFWWVRYFSKGKIVKRTTKTTNQRDAIAFAKTFYEDILLRERNLLPVGKNPVFEKLAYMLLEEQEHLIARGERNIKININDKQKLEKDILPFFKGMDIKDITYKKIESYITTLQQRNLAPATLKTHLNLIHKILMLANREGLLDKLPQMPKVQLKDNPRVWFTANEYRILRNTLANIETKNIIVRYHKITDELRYLVTFMVNTFLRPSDIKELRHRNIEVIEEDFKYLRIQTEKAKALNAPVVSMPSAVGIYNDLVNHHKTKEAPYKRDDFVFFPNMMNREYALRTMSRQFNEILKIADLKKAPTGEDRTLYSLRHTAIMLRLTMGKNVDLLTLARNARTSVEMIERFYAKPLQAEMNISKIQSMRSKPKKKIKEK